MLRHGDSANALSKAAPIFSALGDPVRLAIVARLSKDGPLPTIELKQCAGGVSRQGVTKHLQVLEDVGLVAKRPGGARPAVAAASTAVCSDARHPRLDFGAMG